MNAGRGFMHTLILYVFLLYCCIRFVEPKARQKSRLEEGIKSENIELLPENVRFSIAYFVLTNSSVLQKNRALGSLSLGFWNEVAAGKENVCNLYSSFVHRFLDAQLDD